MQVLYETSIIPSYFLFSFHPSSFPSISFSLRRLQERLSRLGREINDSHHHSAVRELAGTGTLDPDNLNVTLNPFSTKQKEKLWSSSSIYGNINMFSRSLYPDLRNICTSPNSFCSFARKCKREASVAKSVIGQIFQWPCLTKISGRNREFLKCSQTTLVLELNSKKIQTKNIDVYESKRWSLKLSSYQITSITILNLLNITFIAIIIEYSNITFIAISTISRQNLDQKNVPKKIKYTHCDQDTTLPT